MDLNELERRQGGLAPVLMAVGGAVGVAGSLLTWASVQVTRGAGRQQRRLGGQGRTPGASGRAPGQGMPQGSLPQGRIGGGGRSFTIHGLDTTGGKIALAMFIALIVVATVAWLALRFWFRFGAMALGLVLGVIVLASTAIDLASPDSLFGVVGTRLAIAGIPVAIGVGLWFAVAGAVVAVASAVFWLVATRRSWAGPAAAPSHQAPPPPPYEPRLDEQPTRILPPLTEPGLSSE